MKTTFKTKNEYNYKMMIAGKERIVDSITLTQIPNAERWSISVKESKRDFREIAKEIISSSDNLLFEEIEFLRNVYRMSFDELGEYLGLPLEEVIKFRKTQGSVDSEKSSKIKSLLKLKTLS